MPRYIGVQSSSHPPPRVPGYLPTHSSTTTTASAVPASSDYGSDLDTEGEEIVDALLSELERKQRVHDGRASPSEYDDIEDADLLAAEASVSVQVAAAAGQRDGGLLPGGGRSLEMGLPIRSSPRGPLVEVEYDSASRGSWTVAKNGAREKGDVQMKETEPEQQNEDVKEDTRAPIERFRAKRPLSVTDLVSPAWCELQYYFSLSKHGRVRRTREMKAGSKVHKELELQVHEVVPVDVKTREDSWGLRLWNVIQGLRTLRATGMTRELEVWAIVEGEVVNGVIDELGYECPDADLEAGIDASLAEYDEEPPPDGRRVYLTDIKSRAQRNRSNLPSGASLRPTKMQLMLYRHLLLTLCDSLPADAEPVFARYKIDPSKQFSEQFISEISSLEFNFRPENVTPESLASASSESETSQNAAPFATQESAEHELRVHNSPRLLWSLMLKEVAQAFGPSPRARISPVLRAEFRAQGSGEFIGQRTFVHDQTALEVYARDEIRWWRGLRDARGVRIEEAFKCGICEFAEGCEWRLGKVKEGIDKMRMKGGKRKSIV